MAYVAPYNYAVALPINTISTNELRSMIEESVKKAMGLHNPPSAPQHTTQRKPTTINPPEPWIETFWIKVLKFFRPKRYRAELEFSAKLWERYLEFAETGNILPYPKTPAHMRVGNYGGGR